MDFSRLMWIKDNYLLVTADTIKITDQSTYLYFKVYQCFVPVLES